MLEDMLMCAAGHIAESECAPGVKCYELDVHPVSAEMKLSAAPGSCFSALPGSLRSGHRGRIRRPDRAWWCPHVRCFYLAAGTGTWVCAQSGFRVCLSAPGWRMGRGFAAFSRAAVLSRGQFELCLKVGEGR